MACAPLPTQAERARAAASDILAGRWFVSSDTAAYRAKVTEAAQCALDGDDTDLCIYIAEAAAFELTGVAA